MQMQADRVYWLSKKLYVWLVGISASVLLNFATVLLVTKFWPLVSVKALAVIVVVATINAILLARYEVIFIKEKRFFRPFRKWPSESENPDVELLSTKLKLYAKNMAIFYVTMAASLYVFYQDFGYNFYLVFMSVYFCCMMREELVNVFDVYEQQMTNRLLMRVVLWSAVCALVSTGFVWGLVSCFGTSLWITAFIVVMLIKLIQPLGSRKFILGL